MVVIPRRSQMRKRIVTTDFDQRKHAPIVSGPQNCRQLCFCSRRACLLDECFISRKPCIDALGFNVYDVDSAPRVFRERNRWTAWAVVDGCVALEIFVRARHRVFSLSNCLSN
jgi:hypothetical protein